MGGRTKGMTLLETLIAGSLTTAVLAMTCDAFAAVSAASEASTRIMLATSRANQIAATLAGELRSASAGTIVVSTPEQIAFTPVTGYASGDQPHMILGDSVALAMEPDGALRRRTFAEPGVEVSCLELARDVAAVTFGRLPDGRVVVTVTCAFASPQAGVSGTRAASVTIAPRNARRSRGQRRGSALIVAIVFTTVMLVIALGVVELAVAARRGALASGARAQAAAIAEAGVDAVLCGVARGASFDGNVDATFAGGRYLVTVVPRTDGSGVHDLHAVGTSGAERAVIDVAAVKSGATVVVCSWVRQQ